MRGRPAKKSDNRTVKQWVHPYWVSGCYVGTGKGVKRLPHAIEDSIFGAIFCDAEGYVGQPKLSASRLMTILATMSFITTRGILDMFGEKENAIVLKRKGIGERQAQNYAIAARIASESIKRYMEQHPDEALAEIINEPTYKEDIRE